MMSEKEEQIKIVFQVNTFAEFWEIFKMRQDDLSRLSKCIAEETRTRICDVNGSEMIFEGIGYPQRDIKELLKAIGAPFNPPDVCNPPLDGSKQKEFRLSVHPPWGQDRVM